MNIDLLCTWPRDFDFPLFRKFVRDHRNLFNRVIFVFSNMNTGFDYRQEIEADLGSIGVAFMNAPQHFGGEDWRNAAVNHGLGYADGDVIWFCEQDFSMVDPDEFFAKARKALEDNDALGYFESEGAGSRLHPSCLFVKRRAVEGTKKDFSPVVDYFDHFWKFSQDLKKKYKICTLSEAGITPDDWNHMNGLVHNLRLYREGKEVTYHPEEFYAYLAEVNKPNENIS